MNEPILLFTYGTMRSECYNNGRIKGSKFIGHAVTCEPMVMVAKTHPRQIPYVGRVADTHHLHGNEMPIEGEVYLIDRATLQRVDRAEGHPYVYEREYCYVRMFENGEVLKCYIYVYDVEETEYKPVPTGDFMDFYSPEKHKQQRHYEGKFHDPTMTTHHLARSIEKKYGKSAVGSLVLPFSERKNR